MNIEQILLGMKIYSKKGIIFILDKEEQLLLLEYINNIEKENEKLNHYKLLYQKVKERNDEAIEYIEGHMMNPELMDEFEYISTSPKQLLKILKGNIEEVSND